MTIEEHMLMMGILGAQMETTYTLMELLKSRGIIEGDDLKAFFAIRTQATREETMNRAHELYALIAKQVGIDIPGPTSSRG
jgi:hypothetical protein